MTQVLSKERTKGKILEGPPPVSAPSWFQEQQRAAWETFESIPAPKRKDQAWRLTSVDLLDLSPYALGPSLSDDDRANVLKYSRGLDQCAGRLIFARDQLVSKEIFSDDLKKRGVIFQTLEEAIVDHPDLV